MLSLLRRYALPALLAFGGLGGTAGAVEYKAGSLTITDPWVRANPGGAQVGGGVTITNTGSSPDRLLGGTSSVAARVEVHVTSNDGGTAQMHPVQGGVEIKPGESVKLAPGGRHLMFIGLKQPFMEGELVDGMLQFESAGRVPLKFAVQSGGLKAPAHQPNKH